jgi:hypothetical protein
MPITSIFQTLRERVLKSNGLLPAEKRAMFWFSEYSAALRVWQTQHRNLLYGDLRQDTFSKQIVTTSSAFPGYLYFFLYDPKLRDSLPYYDQFPFVLVLDRQPGTFLGLNFHYLDYMHRAMLFDALYPLRENDRDLRTRIQVTYDILQASSKYKMFRPCLKRYLTQHVQSPLMKVGHSEWDIALFLPVESFVKQTPQTVWKESKQKF